MLEFETIFFHTRGVENWAQSTKSYKTDITNNLLVVTIFCLEKSLKLIHVS